jgi:hypothetical protein
VPPASPLLGIGEQFALVMTFLSLFGCVAILFVSLVGAFWPPKGEEPPPYTGKQEDYYKQSAWRSREANRVREREEQRQIITQGVTLLAGAGVGFLALALLARAARSVAEDSKPTPGMHLARFLPGLVALVCATMILTFALSRPPEATMPPMYPSYGGGAFATAE